MKILAVDTCLGNCSVSVYAEGKNLCLLTEKDGSKLAERLLDMVEKALKNSKSTYDDLDLIATTIGPGSFTGIRIGIAAAKGLKIATKKPLIGLSTLETIAFKARKRNQIKEKKIAVLLDARRDQFYVQKFSNEPELQALDEPKLIDKADLKKYMNDDCFIAENINFDASDVAELAALRFKGEKNMNVTPLYIRPPDAKLPGKKLA